MVQHVGSSTWGRKTSRGVDRLQSNFAEKALGQSHYVLSLSQKAVGLWEGFLGREL